MIRHFGQIHEQSALLKRNIIFLQILILDLRELIVDLLETQTKIMPEFRLLVIQITIITCADNHPPPF